MKKPKYQTLKGMYDILPDDFLLHQKIFDTVKEVADFYNFLRVETPILEDSELFVKGTGVSTDVVQKQMFSFKSKGGDTLVLRPEGTPPIVRAYLEHGMFNWPQPVKLWYFGPYFRYENPQAGRHRQFWQFGFEIIGERTSVADSQIIIVLYNILQELKIKNPLVEINSIGDPQCRPYYRKALSSYLRGKESIMCADCKRRLKENPLRVLDCKEEKCQPLKGQAPQMFDQLCEDCKKHFKEVLEYLEEMNVSYRLSPYLVRGLDYYTKTVFEFFEESEDNHSQIALGGGGRYDSLVKILGGKDTPAVGGGMGVERIAMAMQKKEEKEAEGKKVKVFLAQLGYLGKKKSFKLFEEFRKAGVAVGESFDRDSLKSQLKVADKYEAQYTLILGQKEALEGTVLVRDMASGQQESVKMDKIVSEIKKRLKK